MKVFFQNIFLKMFTTRLGYRSTVKFEPITGPRFHPFGFYCPHYSVLNK